MAILINSIRQIVRTPLKTGLFVLFITASAVLLTLGIGLLMICRYNLQQYESTFVTIGTIEQIPNTIETVAQWDSGKGDYNYFNRARYDSIIPLSTLDVNGAEYIHSPEWRPYYGAWHESYNVTYTEDIPLVIVEAEPLEDCVPTEPVRMAIKDVLFGSMSNMTEFWFCDHYSDNPEPMYAGTTYIMLVQQSPMTTHADRDPMSFEYIPTMGFVSTQYDKTGNRIVDSVDDWIGWDEVTEGYYETERGSRWSELIEALEKYMHTIPVVPTGSTHLLMDFFTGNSEIAEGRDISPEEYERGDKVCLIQRGFAATQGLSVGDTLPLPMYYANYANSPNSHFYLEGGLGLNFSLLNAEGESYEAFADGEYTIVGIYDVQTGSYQNASFGSAANLVVIPSRSVEGDDADNIVAFLPMQAFNSSFEIPNGSISSYSELIQEAGLAGLSMEFYDNGYTQIKAGLDNMQTMATALIVAGMSIITIALMFSCYLFILKEQQRTAIERSLGVPSFHCVVSLLAGLLILLVLSTAIGTTIAWVASGNLLSRALEASSTEVFDLTFSGWVNNTDKVSDVGMDLVAIPGRAYAVVMLTVLGLGVLISSIGIYRNLKKEPLALLNQRE